MHRSQLSIARETDCVLYVGNISVLSYCPLTLQMCHDLTQKKACQGWRGLLLHFYFAGILSELLSVFTLFYHHEDFIFS